MLDPFLGLYDADGHPLVQPLAAVNLIGSDDAETLTGGLGDDALWLLDGDGDDSIRTGQGNDFVSGGEGADRMSGGAGRDIVLGGNGNDVIATGFDADLVYAGRGNDSVGGGSGDDILFSGAGNDTLTGGQSSDVFVFNTFTAGEIDTIKDFNPIALNTSAFFTPPSSRLPFHIGGDPDELDPLTAFASLDTSDADTGATITIAEHTVILEGVFAADISVGDFIFLSGPMDAHL